MGEPEGHWTPAGARKGQQDAYRRHQVFQRGQLQSADPRGLAERWSSIVELPLRKDSQDRIELPLENASVRFVEATEAAAKASAASTSSCPIMRGCWRRPPPVDARSAAPESNQDQVMICGVRFNLL